MTRIDDDAPLEQNYEALGAALEPALARLQLAVEQLKTAAATLEAGAAMLGEAGTSEEAEAQCGLDLTIARMIASRALTHIWSAADPLSDALGFDAEEEDGDEGEGDDEEEEDDDDDGDD